MQSVLPRPANTNTIHTTKHTWNCDTRCDVVNHTHTMIQAFSMREHHFGICALCSNLLQHFTYYTQNTLTYQQLQLGSVSYKMSLTLCVMLSGNFISNETIRSPFRLGSFGNGSPWPWIRLAVVGFTISFIRLSGILSPVSVGILMIEPHKACNKKRFQFIIDSNCLLQTTLRPQKEVLSTDLHQAQQVVTLGTLVYFPHSCSLSVNNIVSNIIYQQALSGY